MLVSSHRPNRCRNCKTNCTAHCKKRSRRCKTAASKSLTWKRFVTRKARSSPIKLLSTRSRESWHLGRSRNRSVPKLPWLYVKTPTAEWKLQLRAKRLTNCVTINSACIPVGFAADGTHFDQQAWLFFCCNSRCAAMPVAGDARTNASEVDRGFGPKHDGRGRPRFSHPHRQH